MQSTARLLYRRSTAAPGAVAFVEACDGATLTWRELAEHAELVTAIVSARRLAPGTRIAIAAEDPLAFAAMFISCLASGLCAVPIDSRAPAVEVAATVESLRAEVLATDRPDLLAIDAPLDTELWYVDQRGIEPVDGARRERELALRPAALLTSSGTTGSPKGIPLEECQLLGGALRIIAHHRLSASDLGYSPLPLFHINAQVVAVLSTLLAGSSMALDRRFDRSTYWSRVAAVQPSWLNAVPAILAAAADLELPADLDLDRIRFVRTASAPLPALTLRRFERHSGLHVLETYGMTEAAGQITANPLDETARRPGSVGRPVGIELRVAISGRPVPAGEVGAVELRGESVVRQYVELAAHGEERLRPARDLRGWLPTGDLGYFDNGGFLYLVGRADDVINRGGDKIQPREVEELLLEHPAVTGAAVVGKPHHSLGELPVAYVVAPAAEPTLLGELESLCAERLVRWKRPVEILFVDSLPFGPTGKVLRRSLRAMGAASEAPALSVAVR